MQSLVEALRRRYAVHYVGIGYKGPEIRKPGLTIYPCNLHGGDVYGSGLAQTLIERLRPRLVLLLNDLWVLHNYRNLGRLTERPTVVAYVPLDGRLVDPSWIEPLGFIDCWVAYTEFARGELARGLERLEGGAKRRVEVIPHGVDRAVFRPLGPQDGEARRGVARRRAFPGLASADRAFVVLNANRPQPRKRIDLTIRGFAEFARGKPPHVQLCLHHAVMGAEEREPILSLAASEGILDRLIMSPEHTGLDDSDAALNELYNACDLGLNTSMGEGWGLVSFEHAATGAAQVVPSHSACGELWKDAALLVDPTNRYVPRFSPLEMAEVDAASVASALQRLYENEALRAWTANACHARATRPEYDWERISAQWDSLFEGLLQ